jgi:hypothetical protein
LAQVASRLNLSEESIAGVFEVEDGELQLILRRAMLPEPGKKAASMRHVALLVVVGRQAIEPDEWTPLDVVRDECREMGVLDPSNFATEIAKLDFKSRGDRSKRELKATRHHMAEVASLISDIATGSQ